MIEKIKGWINSNKQKATLFGSIALVMLLIIISISVAVKFVGIKISYENLEEILETATYRYLSENPNYLPNANNPTIVVNSSTLIEQKYIKELKKYVKDSSCTANIMVDFVNNDYSYQAYLTCKEFKTEKFVDKIKENNKISQTGEGLYEMNNELVFRGQNPNNYVSIADEIWRIVKIDNNNTIQIILTETEDNDLYSVWDDRYNTEANSNYGINNFNLSRVLIFSKKVYDTKYKKYEEYLTKFDLCVGKRLNDSTDKSGRLECNEKIQNQEIGLLPLYDYMNASLDAMCQTSISKECQNYNYFVNEDSRWWTMTGNMVNTYSAFSISTYGEIDSDNTSYSADLRFVIALKNGILYKSGNGTRENPYVIR